MSATPFTAADQQELFGEAAPDVAGTQPSAVSGETTSTEVTDPENPQLTADEENFALAIVESGGNAGDAYRLVFGKDPMAKAKGYELLAREQIATRVSRLHESINQNSLISLGSHLMELADIRDLGKVTGQLKVALHAEVKRGEVGGFYSRPPPPETPHVNVNINMASPEDLMKYANKKMQVVEDITPKG